MGKQTANGAAGEADGTEVAVAALRTDTAGANGATEQAEVEGHFLHPVTADMVAKVNTQDLLAVAQRERRAAKATAAKSRDRWNVPGRLRRRDG